MSAEENENEGPTVLQLVQHPLSIVIVPTEFAPPEQESRVLSWNVWGPYTGRHNYKGKPIREEIEDVLMAVHENLAWMHDDAALPKPSDLRKEIEDLRQIIQVREQDMDARSVVVTFLNNSTKLRITAGSAVTEAALADLIVRYNNAVRAIAKDLARQEMPKQWYRVQRADDATCWDAHETVSPEAAVQQAAGWISTWLTHDTTAQVVVIDETGNRTAWDVDLAVRITPCVDTPRSRWAIEDVGTLPSKETP